MPGAFEAARDQLYSDTNSSVLILVYIGIASCTLPHRVRLTILTRGSCHSAVVSTYIFMYAFVTSGESNTRRVREAYLAAVLRQNVAFFDKVGAGEITTRIENDTHLLQEGISEKVAISVMHVAMFFAGFAVAFSLNWRLTVVLICIVPCIGIA